MLDKDEMRQFVDDYVGTHGSPGAIGDEAFEEVFQAFDEDKSGTVDKAEVTAFILKLVRPPENYHQENN